MSPGQQQQQPQREFDCLATAAFLRSLAPLVWAAHAVAVIAACAARQYAWAILPFWAITLSCAVRVQFDARLFELLAQNLDHGPALLDAWLHKSDKPQRTIEDRCRGGRHLGFRLMAAFTLQTIAALVLLLGGSAS